MVQNGHDIHFWKDKWILGAGTIYDAFQDHISIGQEEFLVSFYATHDSWCMETLEMFLLEIICSNIVTSRLPNQNELVDFPN